MRRPVLTYRGRRGRISALTRERSQVLLPRYSVPPEGLVTSWRGAPLVIDIGCGHGGATLAYAEHHRAHDVVAVDVHVPGLARLAAAIEDQGLDSVHLHQGDAVPLLGRVADTSLAAALLLFPDPWPKSKHVKRRFVAAERLELVLDKLMPGAALHVATDQPAYVDYLVDQASRLQGARVTEVERPPWRPVAGFEVAAVAAGRTVVDVVVWREVDGVSGTGK